MDFCELCGKIDKRKNTENQPQYFIEIIKISEDERDVDGDEICEDCYNLLKGEIENVDRESWFERMHRQHTSPISEKKKGE